MTAADEVQRCEIDCARLCNDFAFYVDTHAYIELSKLFIHDGTFERNGEILKGRDAILLSMAKRPKDIVTRHFCTNIRIQPQYNGTAFGTCYLQLFHSCIKTEDETQPPKYSLTLAEYKDVYLYTAEGWRIQSRIANVVF